MAEAKLIHYVPERWAETLRAYRRQRQFRDAGIVFIHVPKAAGTSITDAIYGRFLGHFELVDVLRTGSKDVLTLPRFSVVRNPWDRLLSAYRFARAGKGSVARVKEGDDTVVDVTIRFPERYQGASCSSFDRFVAEWLDGRELSKLDSVFRPQSDYLVDRKGKIGVDHLGRVEDLKATEKWLCDVLRRRTAIPHMNSTGQKIDYRTQYSPETRAIVERLYARDIELLGYAF